MEQTMQQHVAGDFVATDGPYIFDEGGQYSAIINGFTPVPEVGNLNTQLYFPKCTITPEDGGAFWVTSLKESTCECSRCGYTIHPSAYGNELPERCPHCGARMEGGRHWKDYSGCLTLFKWQLDD